MLGLDRKVRVPNVFGNVGRPAIRAASYPLTLVSNWLDHYRWLIKAAYLPLAESGYKQNSVVYSCLKMLASGTSEPILQVYRLQPVQPIAPSTGAQQDLQAPPQGGPGDMGGAPPGAPPPPDAGPQGPPAVGSAAQQMRPPPSGFTPGAGMHEHQAANPYGGKAWGWGLRQGLEDQSQSAAPGVTPSGAPPENAVPQQVPQPSAQSEQTTPSTTGGTANPDFTVSEGTLGTVRSTARVPLGEDHPLIKLLRHPNELLTESKFWYLTTLYVGIAGTAYWFKERDNLGNIIALWPLRPDRVGPIYSVSQEAGQKVIYGWSYQIPGKSLIIEIARADVVFFNLPDPAGESGGLVEGLGSLQVLAREMAADNEATNFVGSILNNAAVTTVALKVKSQIPNEQAARLIKQNFMDQFGGSRRGEPAVLDADTDIQQLGFNLQELEFPNVRGYAEARIASTIGVPAQLVGLKVGLDKSAFANVAEARRYFTETTLSFYWKLFRDQIQLDLLPEFEEGDGEGTLVAEWDLSQVKALIQAREQQVQPIADAWKNGAATRNEYRRALGLDPLPPEAGLVFIIPVMNQLVSIANIPLLPQMNTSNPESLIDTQSGLTDRNATFPEMMFGPLDDVIMPYKPPKQPRQRVQQPQTNQPINRPPMMRSFDSVVHQGAFVLSQTFDDIRPEAVEGIKSGQGSTKLGPRLTLALRAIMTPIIVERVLVEGQKIGLVPDPADATFYTNMWLDEYLSTRVQELVDSTEMLLNQVQAMDLNEEALNASLMPAFGSQRAWVVATREALRAFSAGQEVCQSILKKFGIDTVRYWETAPSEKYCPICSQLDGKPQSEWPEYLRHGPPGHNGCFCQTHVVVTSAKPAD